MTETNTGHELSLSQRFFKAIMPAKVFASMERESREWKLVCDHCGAKHSVWELGGIRAGAKSKGKRMLARCGACGKRSMQRIVREPESD